MDELEKGFKDLGKAAEEAGKQAQNAKNVAEATAAVAAAAADEDFKRRVKAGTLGFSDFEGLLKASGSYDEGAVVSDDQTRMLDEGKRIIAAMTEEEKKQPALFEWKDDPAAKNRIRRVAKEAGVEVKDMKRFLKDFAQLSQFLMHVAGGMKREKALEVANKETGVTKTRKEMLVNGKEKVVAAKGFR